jgi:hypothetical protein
MRSKVAPSGTYQVHQLRGRFEGGSPGGCSRSAVLHLTIRDREIIR